MVGGAARAVLRRAGRRLQYRAALAVVFDWVREANRSAPGTVGDQDLRAMLDVLGLANLLDHDHAEAPAEVRELLAARERARAKRDYAEADGLREQLRALGWEVRDGPDGPQVRPVHG